MNTIHHQQKTQQLSDAFRLFNELSQNLSESYQGLEWQVVKLRQELIAARSERLQTLIEKEKLANRLQRVLSALPAGVVELDEDGYIADCNTVAVDFLKEPLTGIAWSEVAARSLIPVFDNPHERQLLDGRQVNIVISKLGDAAGQIILLSEVTEMRALQDLVNQQKHLSAMGEMVASMAHQVRTPLATAILYTSQLDKPSLPSGKRQHYAKKILERLHHLERQVNDMLIFAKEGRIAMQEFSLTELLNHLAVAMEDYKTEEGIQFSINNQAKIDGIIGNEDALHGALMNLLSNAVEAVAGQGHIQLSVLQLAEGKLQISIKDNGPGIDAAHRERLFEPFFTTRINGTGLGLAVVDSVAKAHGGSVNCASRKGVGSVFTLLLPCHQTGMCTLPGGFSGREYHEMEMEMKNEAV
jgi:two-component system, sensor histidine kinase FlrB